MQTGAELARIATEQNRELAEDLIERARRNGLQLVGENGLLTGLVKLVLEGALEAEMADHLGYEKGDPAGAGSGNHRNGTSRKTVLSQVGPVQINIPRDRAGNFNPQIVPKHSRRVDGFSETIISLYAKGLTTGEIQAHLAEVYDIEVSRDLVSRATAQVAQDLAAWRTRPLDRVYAVLLIDCIYIKIRDGAVANKPVYIAVGINLDGDRDVLGMWVGTGGEGPKQWMTWLTELRNRGIQDVLIACCDGLKGLPESINDVWPQTDVQLCVVMVRTSLRYAAKQYWGAIARQLKEVYTAKTADEAEQRFARFEEEWGERYPAVIDTWRRSWEHMIVFMRFPAPIRRVVYTTNMIESLNSRFRQASRRRGHFPDDDAALKVLYLVIQNPIKNHANVTGRTQSWKQAINSLASHYGDRVTDR
ncbi:IS256 family transposase [Streptacidiphilus pinicola]|uniref:Mutator family transposase n=1 Tax=Streptacidiphilus pinicola TaxID=2219663 RepID=A0A2X0JUS0_9ACTN|nr:IS256 family transposase [Streptacidiphilus pinicola]